MFCPARLCLAHSGYVSRQVHCFASVDSSDDKEWCSGDHNRKTVHSAASQILSFLKRKTQKKTWRANTPVFNHYAKWCAFAIAQVLIWFQKPRATAEHQVEAIMQNLPWRFEFGVSGFCLFFCHHLVTECQKLLLLLNFRDVFAWYGSARANLFFIF